MRFLDIVLIIISSAGLLHGVLFALYLIVFKKKKGLSSLLLGLILIFMAFRIGKSVMLNFGDGLEPVFIFIGLAFLLIIGPLLRWYVLSMTRPDFKLPRYYLLELAPFILFFMASLFVTKDWYSNSKWVIIIFSSGLIFIYLHFATYIAMAWRIFRLAKKKHQKAPMTKSQKAVFNWLKPLLIGFVVIWWSYVLNILDEAVPYVIGPIMYSLVIYYLSYKAFQLKATDMDGHVFKPNNDHQLFEALSKLMVDNKLYLEPDLSLTKLSKMLGKSTQQISLVINQCAQRNFNDYINYYRIQDAKALLSDPENEKYTISSIAFDMGFSSLSSFNTAFKKFEGTTPSAYRKKMK
ncbi:helix-turn-helix domain-containing protein [Tamlana sp. 2201CG12-4]|uniref:helix-turn-helix domain-containing protein n=1 Tax=Tamlana sp. 2201CG12-4 TaxID=3112582 RepID=UPI002DB95460|nr:helix-turn-helix domain-containing protein [Tamlana sp. 2201CG12-4]MEC3908117.1 helix-turn-helix domain-containing protein [Tamlana sp. 2201CG12-4]